MDQKLHFRNFIFNDFIHEVTSYLILKKIIHLFCRAYDTSQDESDDVKQEKKDA